MKKILSLDLETYSHFDLAKIGTYRYAQECYVDIIGYAYDDDEPTVIDMLHGQGLPQSVFEDLNNPDVIKSAFNASFERAVLSAQKILVQTNEGIVERQVTIHPEQWQDTMVLAYQHGLQGSLADVGARLGLNENLKKDTKGKALIALFATPKQKDKRRAELQAFLAAARANNVKAIQQTKWCAYLRYNYQDVIAERAIRKRLESLDLAMPSQEREVEILDAAINKRGIRVDATLVKFAMELDDQLKKEAKDEGNYLVGGNLNSIPYLAKWLEGQGVKVPTKTDKVGRVSPNLDKVARAEIAQQVLDLHDPETASKILKALRLKEVLSKTSVKKYEVMQAAKDKEDRVHGMLQYYGAPRTGRWAGRLVQLHNLPQTHLDNLDEARNLLRNRDFSTLKAKYQSPSDVLSQLIRTAFIPKAGCRLLVADYSAIEARVLAWLAGESWVLDAFRGGHDIYCETASKMFGVPVQKKGENSELRQKGKVATLACGYQGAVGALKAFGADRMGLNDEQLKSIVDQWRRANPHITRYWRTLAEMMLDLIGGANGQTMSIQAPLPPIKITLRDGNTLLTLPSGRSLVYPHVRVDDTPNNFGSYPLCYDGVDEKGKWGKVTTFGGKLAENVTQAVARDCLAEAMLRLNKAGYQIVMHVHDEIICEMQEGDGSVEEMVQLMCTPPAWAQGLPLSADGFEAYYYHK